MRLTDVAVRRERRRGCGFRKPGGLYIVGGSEREACAALPLPLDRCRVCGGGIKPSRGWTWIAPDDLWQLPIAHGSPAHESRCPLGGSGFPDDRAGLLWIGESYYPTPEAFESEARAQGVSRRIAAVPRGFGLGQWVLLAHRRTVPCMDCGGPSLSPPVVADSECSACGGAGMVAGVFTLFRPSAIEYVVRGDESEAELDALTERGITPVQVIREADPLPQMPLPLDRPERVT